MVSKTVDLVLFLVKHAWKRWRLRKAIQIKAIVVHCTGSDNQDPHKTNAYHVGPNHISKTGCPRICYADFIDKIGTRYLCNSPLDITWQAGVWNAVSVGIVMANTGKDRPPVAQIQALLSVILEYCLRFKIPPIKPRWTRGPGLLGHSEAGWLAKKSLKLCPGRFINLDAMRLVICLRMQTLLRDHGLYMGGLDGKWGKKSKAALAAFVYAEVEPLDFSEAEADQVIRR